MAEFKYEPMPKNLKVYRERIWVEQQMQTRLLKEMNGSVKVHETRLQKVEGDITKVKIIGATLTGLATVVFGFGKTIIKALH